MKIISWNINSVRLRLPALKKLAEETAADIICLQETKVQDQDFPVAEIKALGYEHVLFRGEKSYNGVAILSKVPLRLSEKLDVAGVEQSRHLSAYLPCGTEIHNIYIPAGGDEPCIEVNPKFRYKLEFVTWLENWFASKRQKTDPMILLGDFNIAPLEHDVWSSKQLQKVVSHTPIEREHLNALQRNLNWLDVPRHFVPEEEKLYSWWSYRNRDWEKSNRGRRLDHIWVTPGFAEPMSHDILYHVRNWEKPSDHVPVIMNWK